MFGAVEVLDAMLYVDEDVPFDSSHSNILHIVFLGVFLNQKETQRANTAITFNVQCKHCKCLCVSFATIDYGSIQFGGIQLNPICHIAGNLYAAL